jgi:hypothetical protein
MPVQFTLTNGLVVQQEKRRALAKDPLVLTALDVFTGQVGDIRTRLSTSVPDRPKWPTITQPMKRRRSP